MQPHLLFASGALGGLDPGTFGVLDGPPSGFFLFPLAPFRFHLGADTGLFGLAAIVFLFRDALLFDLLQLAEREEDRIFALFRVCHCFLDTT
ncbi:MAG TPA: hypothetical protein VML75_03660 [Kofleriaceae bacterium]|nr:hypothetical protein [Kofleriaceae bacterium]